MLAAAHGAVQVWGIVGKIRFAVVRGNAPHWAGQMPSAPGPILWPMRCIR